MSDLIDRQAAIDAILEDLAFDSVKELRAYVSKNKQDDYFYGGVLHAINAVQDLPSAQPEQNNDSEFWRKRADYYSDMCMKLIGEMGKGVKIASVKISANGIEFIKEQPPQPERKTGRWIPQDHNYTHGNISTCMYFSPVCSECGHAGDFNMNYCPNCGCMMEVEHE